MLTKYILFDFLNVVYKPEQDFESPLTQQYRQQKSNKFQMREKLEESLNYELLQKLEVISKSYKTALLTASTGLVNDNSPFKEFLESKFDHIFTTQDFELPKSKPEIYVQLADKLDIEPQEILFIDDMQSNIDAAKQAGVKTIKYVSNDETIPEIIKELS